MRAKFILHTLVIILLGGSGLKAAPKVFLLSASSSQPYNAGMNIVDELSRYANNLALSGQGTFYRTPEKKYVLPRAEIVAMSGTPSGLAFATKILIYEKVDRVKSGYNHLIQGIAFIKERTEMDGRETTQLLAYLEFEWNTRKGMDTVKPVYNMAGNYGRSLGEIVRKHSFTYSVVADEKEVFSTQAKRERAERKYFRQESKKDKTQTRLITYRIEPDISEKGLVSRQLIYDAAAFFTLNPQEFYNTGGNRLLDLKNKPSILISGIEVTEIWDCTGTNAKSIIHSIKFLHAGIPMDEVSPELLDEWNMVTVPGIPFTEALARKDFAYRITMINSEPVGASRQIALLNALTKCEWESLSQYNSR